ncbi:hypothetical protein HYPDE_35453 [Hyphomicrobium denitrificans 1NES1]|uniref:Uncharacterized protein n=1 Tax=Hyphomicrobium denitrificans 1NES1 TaxID=670307 RepID=N0B8Z2_9HYPH|nr:hypothetical protein HYPDE_35453 [Hyphomicrobium denitrificans 1NES1]
MNCRPDTESCDLRRVPAGNVRLGSEADVKHAHYANSHHTPPLHTPTLSPLRPFGSASATSSA